MFNDYRGDVEKDIPIMDLFLFEPTERKEEHEIGKENRVACPRFHGIRHFHHDECPSFHALFTETILRFGKS